MITVPAEPAIINLDTLIPEKTSVVRISYEGTMPGDVLFYIALRGTGLSVRCTQRNFMAELRNIPSRSGIEFDHTVTIRMYKPFRAGHDVNLRLIPGQIVDLTPLVDQ